MGSSMCHQLLLLITDNASKGTAFFAGKEKCGWIIHAWLGR